MSITVVSPPDKTHYTIERTIVIQDETWEVECDRCGAVLQFSGGMRSVPYTLYEGIHLYINCKCCGHKLEQPSFTKIKEKITEIQKESVAIPFNVNWKSE